MQHVWSVLCQRSIVDVDTNLISLVDCLEEITINVNQETSDSIMVPIEFQLVSFWLFEKNSDRNLQLKIELVDPDKKILNSFESNFAVDEGALRFRSRINIQGIPVSVGGRYMLHLLQKSNGRSNHILVSELPLDIVLKRQVNN